jgi:hypothetical protein
MKEWEKLFDIIISISQHVVTSYNLDDDRNIHTMEEKYDINSGISFRL